MQFTSEHQPPNRGRKPKAEQFTGAVARAEKRIVDRLPMLVDRAFELAEGVLVEKAAITAEGIEMRVYREPPDMKAISYLMDRVMGKPQQHVDVTSQGETIKAYVGVKLDDV